MFLLLNRKEDCTVKSKISLFIITKENVSLITSDYVYINLTWTYDFIETHEIKYGLHGIKDYDPINSLKNPKWGTDGMGPKTMTLWFH